MLRRGAYLMRFKFHSFVEIKYIVRRSVKRWQINLFWCKRGERTAGSVSQLSLAHNIFVAQSEACGTILKRLVICRRLMTETHDSSFLEFFNILSTHLAAACTKMYFTLCSFYSTAMQAFNKNYFEVMNFEPFEVALATLTSNQTS